MTNKRITDLPSIAGVDLADSDVFETVDVSDTTDNAAGSSRKITKAELASVIGGGGLSSDYIDALGKVAASGGSFPSAKPVLFDSANTTWDEGFWWQPITRDTPNAGGQRAQWRLAYLPDQDGLIGGSLTVTDGGADPDSVVGDFVLFAGSSPGEDFYGQITMQVSANGDGSGQRQAYVDYFTDLTGEVYIGVGFSAHPGPGLSIKGDVGQTNDLLLITDSANAKIVEVTGDQKIGFYGSAPVALQTGIAVSAAGVHAALVNLGLITA